MYKLIAVDMDGTFLNSNKEVSERNKQAMLDVVRSGKLFVISTGRPLAGVRDILALLPEGSDLPEGQDLRSADLPRNPPIPRPAAPRNPQDSYTNAPARTCSGRAPARPAF